MANNRFKLENMLISSYAHLRSLELKAYFKAHKDLHFDGLPSKYVNQSMTRMQGNRYLMNAYNYDTSDDELDCIDIGTLTAERLETNLDDIVSFCFVEDQYMIMVTYFYPMAIFRNLVKIGEIKFTAKDVNCKNEALIYSRYAQQTGDSVYAVDEDACLYRIEWQDIRDGEFRKSLVKSNVENFYVDGRLGLATINKGSNVLLDSGTEVDLKAKVDSEAKWTILTCIAKCWIVSGDRDIDGHAIMAGISDQGDIRSKLEIRLTSNGYKDKHDDRKFGGIFTLHQA